MNEILRVFKRTFNLFGYDLKRTGKFVLQPLNNYPDPHLKTVYDAFNSAKSKPKQPQKPDLNKLVIFIRTCLRSNRNVDTTPRFTGVSIAETIYRSLRSTIRSINAAHQNLKDRQIEVIILDDHSDASYFAKIKELAQELQCPWQLKTTGETGQGKSLLEQFEMAKDMNALCYFCEDDYLHEVSAIQELWDFYLQMVDEMDGGYLILHPQECDFVYYTHYPSYIVASPIRHWRTMNHATHVLFTHSQVVQNYWPYFEQTKYVGDRKKRQLGAESKTTNLLFQHMPGFCPLPALACHAQQEASLPPCFDWKRIWDENKE